MNRIRNGSHVILCILYILVQFLFGAPVPADVSAFIKALAEKGAAAREAAQQGVTKFAAIVVGEAAERAPVLTGFLKSSQFHEEAKFQGEVIVAAIGFTASYAIFVHERIELHHEQGEAKFLENAIRALSPKFDGFMSQYMQKAIG